MVPDFNDPRHDRRQGDERLEKVFTDMYIGKDADNPPVTLRLDRLEGWMQRVSGNSTWTIRLLIATLVTALVGLAVRVFFGK